MVFSGAVIRLPLSFVPSRRKNLLLMISRGLSTAKRTEEGYTVRLSSILGRQCNLLRNNRSTVPASQTDSQSLIEEEAATLKLTRADGRREEDGIL